MSILDLTSPILNATGFLGFTPNQTNVFNQTLGAYITNPISRDPHTPAHAREIVEYPGGFLLHTGLPNLGLTKTLKTYANQWSRASIPIIPHIFAHTPRDLQQMVEQIEESGLAIAIEIGISENLSAEDILGMIDAATGELPIIAKLALDHALWQAAFAIQVGADVISLGPPRGTLINHQGESVTGRLYGPSLYPQALHTVKTLVEQNIPVIGSGGIYSQAQADEMLNCGAIAVQLDGVLWK